MTLQSELPIKVGDQFKERGREHAIITVCHLSWGVQPPEADGSRRERWEVAYTYRFVDPMTLRLECARQTALLESFMGWIEEGELIPITNGLKELVEAIK